MWISYDVERSDIRGHLTTAAKVGAFVAVSTRLFTPIDPIHAAIYGIITSLVMSIIRGYESTNSAHVRTAAWVISSVIAIPITMSAGVPFAIPVAIPIQMATLIMNIFLYSIKEIFIEEPSSNIERPMTPGFFSP